MKFILLFAFLNPSLSIARNSQCCLAVMDELWEQKAGVMTEIAPLESQRQIVLKGGDVEWDTNPYTFGSVIWDEELQLFRTWYQSFNYHLPPPWRTPVLEARSLDGNTWYRPSFNHLPYAGQPTNAVLLGDGAGSLYSPSVVRDKHTQDPSQRYKMVYWDRHRTNGDGIYSAVSADGVHWQKVAQISHYTSQAHQLADVVDLFQDPVNGHFTIYAKGWSNPFPEYRVVVSSQSEDFINWSQSTKIIDHDRSFIDDQSYGMPVFQVQGVRFGLLRRYNSNTDDTIDIMLYSDAGGQEWRRLSNRAVFDTGPAPAWDAGMVFTTPLIATPGGQLLGIYGGWDGKHNQRVRQAHLGVVTASATRLAYLQTKPNLEHPAELLTRPFSFTSEYLTLEGQLGTGFAASVLNASGDRVLDGFNLENSLCQPTPKPNICHLRWQQADGSLLTPDGRSQPLRLSIRLTQGDRIYSIHHVQLEPSRVL